MYDTCQPKVSIRASANQMQSTDFGCELLLSAAEELNVTTTITE